MTIHVYENLEKGALFMSFTNIVGLLSALFIFVYTILNQNDAMIYVNIPSFIMVIGGTMAAGMICLSFEKILKLFKAYFNALRRNKEAYSAVIKEIMDIADKSRLNSTYIKTAKESTKFMFLSEGLQLIIDGFTEKDIFEFMSRRIDTTYRRHSADADNFKLLARFAPAFGMIGTLVGLVALLRNLGSDDGGQNTIGANMAIALITTFYGSLFANIVLTPIGENLLIRSKDERLLREIIMEGIILIKQKHNPFYIQEMLNSLLLPSERVDIIKLRKGE
jgi:chemotaxis protein MotA